MFESLLTLYVGSILLSGAVQIASMMIHSRIYFLLTKGVTRYDYRTAIEVNALNNEFYEDLAGLICCLIPGINLGLIPVILWNISERRKDIKRIKWLKLREQARLKQHLQVVDSVKATGLVDFALEVPDPLTEKYDPDSMVRFRQKVQERLNERLGQNLK